jgi:hypothetical protein
MGIGTGIPKPFQSSAERELGCNVPAGSKPQVVQFQSSAERELGCNPHADDDDGRKKFQSSAERELDCNFVDQLRATPEAQFQSSAERELDCNPRRGRCSPLPPT